MISLISTKVENTTTDAAQCRYACVLETRSCMISKNFKNTTTDATKYHYAVVVGI